MDRTRISFALVGIDGSPPTVHTMRSESFYSWESSKLKKVNGCFPCSHDHPVLFIPLANVMEDIAYWTKHALICKFLGIWISLSALEAWICRSWQVEGDMEIMLAWNSYFFVVFSCMSDHDHVFEGGPYFYNHVGLFVKPWHSGLILLRICLQQCQFGFAYLAFP